ncbi:MAG: ABC transporter ATP-binding protein [Bdellovibrionales bacterium]|nr:ABC transporter ATP-binding protein [Bdellovibrionales bacterium]
MIEACNLHKSYGHRAAVRDVSFTVNKGEIVGFLGPNGAGKTTTMRMLTGYMSPSQGKVLIDSQDISEYPVEVKQKIGYLPEAPPVYKDMYVRDYLQFTARLKCCPSHKIPTLTDRAIEKAGLQSVQKRLIGNLSKGFQQRVGLAQAIITDPDILILDEPTVGLDPRQVVEIRELLADLKGQHTIILSTHILPEVQTSCDRVIIIHEGSIVTTSTLQELGSKLSAQKTLTLKTRNDSPSLLEKLQSLKGVLSVQDKKTFIELQTSSDSSVNEQVAQVVVSGNFGLLEMKEEGLNLEEVFIRLTDGNKRNEQK